MRGADRDTDVTAAPDPAAFDALLPDAMARKAEQLGVAKAEREPTQLFVLAVLAGAFIALGAMLSTIAATGTTTALPFGAARLLVGFSFSLGLILVVVGGAELFTGDALMVMAAASGRLPVGRMLRAWAIIYVGNFVGALGTALLVFASGQGELGGGAVARTAIALAATKSNLAPLGAFVAGILCNVLVCLAVWLSYSARSVADKILAVVPPVTAFVAAGMEHSVANMYFIPLGLLLQHARPALAAPGLTPLGLVRNLVPVTAGNVVGGAMLVGAVYWFVYLRRR